VVSGRKDVDCSFTVAILVGVMHCLLKGLRITFSPSCGLVGLTSGTDTSGTEPARSLAAPFRLAYTDRVCGSASL
jgi:hypothetical protein